LALNCVNGAVLVAVKFEITEGAVSAATDAAAAVAVVRVFNTDVKPVRKV